MLIRIVLPVTPSRRTDIEVDRLRPGETEAAARILGRSFFGEPLFAHLFEGCEEAAMVRAVQPWFRGWIRAFADKGEIHTARRDGALVGVGIRTAPGDYPLTGIAKAAFTLRLSYAVLRMGLTSRRAFELPAAAAEIERREPEEPFWHLAWVGVAPEHQGTGVGAALADEVTDLIAQRPAPGWLMTFGAHTRALYERRGFLVEGEIQPIAGGPIGWTLRRDPPHREPGECST